VAIDHTESTFDNVKSFGSTLLNRSLDQLFVLDKWARMNAITTSSCMVLWMQTIQRLSGTRWEAMVRSTRPAPDQHKQSAPELRAGGYLSLRSEGNPTYTASLDPRLKAIVAFAPWVRVLSVLSSSRPGPHRHSHVSRSPRCSS